MAQGIKSLGTYLSMYKYSYKQVKTPGKRRETYITEVQYRGNVFFQVGDNKHFLMRLSDPKNATNNGSRSIKKHAVRKKPGRLFFAQTRLSEPSEK
jgi:hypothetical protein